jgi:MFS family permease
LADEAGRARLTLDELLGRTLMEAAAPDRSRIPKGGDVALAGPKQRWLTRNLMVLTLVSLFQDAASELLYPLLPLLITGVLAAPPVVLGVIEGVADATAGLARYVAGRSSDRKGRKGFIGTGYGLAAVGKVIVAAAGSWPLVLVGRVVDRMGKGVRSAPRDALISASVPESTLGRAFGFHRTGDSLGAVIGPLLGLWALAVMNGDLHAALWWAVIPATLSALLVFFVREPKPPALSEAPVEPRAPRVGRSPLPARFWLVTCVLVVIALVNFSDTLLLLRVTQLGFSTTQVVLAYVSFNTVYTLGSYPAGALTDRWPRPYVYAVGLLAFAVAYVGLGLVVGGPVVFVLLAIYGLFPAFTDGVGKAWVSSLVPAEHRGRAQGVFQALSSGSVLVAGLWAGLLWNAGAGNGTLPLLVSGVGGLVAAIALVALRLVRRRTPPTDGHS